MTVICRVQKTNLFKAFLVFKLPDQALTGQKLISDFFSMILYYIHTRFFEINWETGEGLDNFYS